MRRTIIACGAASAAVACVEQPDPPWQLDHERVIAVRARPPHLRAGEIGRLDALLARSGTATVEDPIGASAAFAPAGLFTAVHFTLDHWEVVTPDEDQLDAARAELGLVPGAPVPLEITLEFQGPLYARKTVWLGDTHPNPSLPAITIAEAPAGAEVSIPVGTEAPLSIDAEPTSRVRWFTSCGRLLDHDAPTALLRVETACQGELAVVVRDALGGVAWRVWPLGAAE